MPISWLRQYVDLPADLTAEALAARLTAFDLKLEEIVSSGISGPLVVGRVLALAQSPQKNGKTINWCRVDVGEHNDPSTPDAPPAPEAADGSSGDVPSRGIICGAHNFVEGDLVVVSLPGTRLPALAHVIEHGEIGARKTYGHVSDGMIVSLAEIGRTGDSPLMVPGSGADGIIVLEPGSAQPGDDAIGLLGLDEVVLDLEVNPDRAYALSMRGVARDASIALGVLFHDPAEVTVDVEGPSYPVRVDDPEACPVFVTREVTGFDPTAPSPAWLVDRITAAGMRPISLAVDVSNYVMLELGQPNHAYDRAKIRGDITVRRSGAGEKVTTLDDVERVLDPADLLIADDAGPIGLAGVMGAAHVEIDGTTTDIVIECAAFDPPTVFRMARRHKLSSEASRRNERGIDVTLQARAATRVAELLVELGGGTVGRGVTIVGEAPARATVTLPADLPARISGVDIDAATCVEALRANSCTVELTDATLAVTPPPWRPDLTDPYDIVEEVLRVVGYDQVPSLLPPAPAGRGLTHAQQLRRRVGLVAAGAGLIEVKTFPFTGPTALDRLGLPADDSRRQQVLLENPLSAEEPGMTTTLLPGLLKALTLNVGRGHPDVQIMELGRVFHPKPAGAEAPILPVDHRPSAEQMAAFAAALPDQPQHLAFVLDGQRERSGWSTTGRTAGWSDALAIVRRIAESLHVDLVVRQAQRAPWHPGRCAEIVVRAASDVPGSGTVSDVPGSGTVIGYAGELHPRVVRDHDLTGVVAAAEIDLDALIAAAPVVGPRPDFSAFPVAKEDLALVVAEEVPAETVAAALRGADPLIESVRLFDVYVGDQVPEGHRSLAFALRLRAPDRTLTDEEIKASREAAVSAAARLGATLRS
ncbi:phenylalanine--tRNA ligase subunit beta [Aeromicrobium sp. CF3.5]|uniref:phenylalanine--tRNA ligase subunit beta n=1 Tax=Aeromicrobium sp. CF3.5 TaxID=3373078 RepID=UPI003EE53B9A